MKFFEQNCNFKILVVDDTPALLFTTVKILKEAKFDVYSAKDGEECMKRLSEINPDIILLDVMLPDINGRDLSRLIKNNPEFSAVFVILISSHNIDSDKIAEGLEDGADGYISRPISNRELLARIVSYCRIISSDRKSKDLYVQFHALFSSMQEGVYLHEMVYDNNGKAIDYRVVDANEASEIQLNIKTDYAIGKLATVLYNTSEAPFLDVYDGVVNTGKPVTFEQYFEPMDKYFLISVYTPSKGKFVTTFTNITERKKGEMALLAKNEELHRVNSEKDKFFSIIAHDLKSPFNSIYGFSELIMDEAKKKNLDGVEEYASIILQSSKHAMELLKNLIEWAQSQTGRLVFNPEYLDMTLLMRNIGASFKNMALHKEVTINYSLSPRTILFADKAMISSVMRNLISNALKFSNLRGTIDVSIEKNGNEFVVKVSDKGIGIPSDILTKLFKIDDGCTRPGTSNEKGTGLGLILCKEFIEYHKGKIWVESKEHIGSTFYFTIPVLAD
ncbi:MAG: hybrid sensor histidine kinase/response regulator [Thiovulaceae bacterium]|nr:hybrid sensor histidine kinase/response regulator [Sulfurimonadaceae bacterium]